MTNATREKITAAVIATVNQVVENADDVDIELLYNIEDGKKLRIKINIMPED